MPDPNDWNMQIIEEFRANHGKVGGMFEGSTLLLLSTTGARSGRRRTNPLGYMPDGDRLVVFASKAGEPTNPDWYHNLIADPSVTVEVGNEEFSAIASVITGEERDRLFAQQVARVPQFDTYQKKTTRVIPVIALKRAASETVTARS